MTARSDLDRDFGELVRAAVRELFADPHPVNRLALDSILSSVGNDERLLELVHDEIAAAAAGEQAALHLHLEGPETADHRARADRFGRFVTAMAEAVKEQAKAIAGRARLSTSLQIEPITVGSIGLTLRVPDSPNPTGTKRLSDVSSIETLALRDIVKLMDAAERSDLDDDDLSALAQTMSAKTRVQLGKASHEIVASDWDLRGVVRQRGVLPFQLELSLGGAKRLESEVRSRVEVEETEVLTGMLTGQDWDDHVAKFKPDPGQPSAAHKFAVAIRDPELQAQVAPLTVPEGGTHVRATFAVVLIYPPGDRPAVRRVRTLEDVVQIPTTGSDSFPGM